MGINLNSIAITYYAIINTIYKDAAPLFVNRVNDSILKYLKNDNDYGIELTVAPLPLTKKSKNIENTFDGVVASFVFSIALSFIPASLITFNVKEREDLVKH